MSVRLVFPNSALPFSGGNAVLSACIRVHPRFQPSPHDRIPARFVCRSVFQNHTIPRQKTPIFPARRRAIATPRKNSRVIATPFSGPISDLPKREKNAPFPQFSYITRRRSQSFDEELLLHRRFVPLVIATPKSLSFSCTSIQFAKRSVGAAGSAGARSSTLPHRAKHETPNPEP
jgi:hypothetical protein